MPVLHRLFFFCWALLWALGIFYTQAISEPGQQAEPGYSLLIPANSITWSLVALMISLISWQILSSRLLTLSMRSVCLLSLLAVLAIGSLMTMLVTNTLGWLLSLLAGALWILALEQLPVSGRVRIWLLAWPLVGLILAMWTAAFNVHSVAMWLLCVTLLWLLMPSGERWQFKVRYTFALGTLTPVLLLLTLLFMGTNLQAIRVLHQYESGEVDLLTLSKVANPFGIMSRLMPPIMQMQYEAGVTTGDPKLLQAYTDWAALQVEQHSSPQLLAQWAHALILIGEFDRAQEVQARLTDEMPLLNINE